MPPPIRSPLTPGRKSKQLQLSLSQCAWQSLRLLHGSVNAHSAHVPFTSKVQSQYAPVCSLKLRDEERRWLVGVYAV